MTKIRFSWTTELIGGVAVFLAMSYVLLANPRILGSIPDRVHDGVTFEGPDAGTIFVSTCLLAGILSIAIGWRAWSPSAIACGMGLNSLMATFAADLGFNWRWLLAINLIVGVIVFVMSRADKNERSLRDRLLRDPNYMPASLSSVVEASVAGMLAGIAVDMIARDEERLTGVARTIPQFANGDGLLPGGVAILALLALVLVSFLFSTTAQTLENAAKDRTGFARGARRLASGVLRALNSVKIIAVAIVIAVLFDNLYGWSELSRDIITGLHFAMPALEGPFHFEDDLRDALPLALIYGGTVAFVLLFDVSGSPHQMLPETPPPSVREQGQAIEDAWPAKREENVRKGFTWEAGGNLIAPFFGVSPTTCYGENNVVRDVGLEPNDGARTGIPAILAGVLFLGALAYAFAQPAEVQRWIAAVPGTAIAVMLAWISLIIASAFYSKTNVPKPAAQPAADGPASPGASGIARTELIVAGFASLAASLWQGLALGLCIGIIVVFAVRLIGTFIDRDIKTPVALYPLALLAGIALIGQLYLF